MKICNNCGAVNSDERFFCVDCNEKLDDAVSKREEELITEGIDTKLENLYNKTDPFYVSVFDKVIGAISLLGSAVTVAVMIIDIFIPSYKSEGLWMALLFYLLSCADAFIPRISWSLEKLRLSFYYNGTDDIEPNSFYKITRKLSIFMLAGIATFFLVTNILLI